MFRIPTRTDLTAYEQRLSLDGKSFDFLFRWNKRDSRWYLSIFEADSEVSEDGSRPALLDSTPILAGTPVLKQIRDRRRPLGEIFPYDTDGREGQQDPTIDDLGTRVKLYYFTHAELLAFDTEGASSAPGALPLGSQDEG